MLALVNTIISGHAKEFSVKTQLNKFYEAIDEIFKLEYGNILLVASSKKDLQQMLDNEWPFFTNQSGMIRRCLRGEQCQNATELMKTLSKYFYYYLI